MIGTKTADELLEHVGRVIQMEGERWRDATAAGLAATNRGLRVDGATYRPLPQYTNQPAFNGSARIVGWSLRAVDGPATVTLHDGHTTDGDAPLTIGLAGDGSSSTQWFGPGGVSFTEGLFVEVSGTVAGGILIGAVD